MDSAANDVVFEALFRQAVIDNFLEELDSLPTDDELAGIYTYSPEHEARMRKLFAREARRARARAVIKLSRRAAAVLVIAAAVAFGALMFVPQVRAAVSRTITEWYEQFVRFTSGAPDAEKTNPEPGYIPEGFSEIMRDYREMITTIIYENEKGVLIIFESARASGSASVDSEDRNYGTEVIDGVEYHTFTSTVDGGENSVVWEAAGQRYTLTSVIFVDELLKTAASVGEK